VLNLSLAWHPAFGDGDVATWKPDVEAAYAALVDAQCRGVVTIVAAGNEAGGPTHREGPAYPAGWGTHAVSAQQCIDALGRQGVPEATDRPLLYAVGAVGDDDVLVGLSRPDSQPALLAYGDHVSLTLAGGVAPVRTGTSFAAATVSTAVSNVLAWRPDLDPHDAVDFVWWTGAHVGPVAPHFDLPHLPPKGAVAEVCHALWKACASNPGPGCSPQNLPVCVAGGGALVEDPAIWASWKVGAVHLPVSPVALGWAPAACDFASIHDGGGGVAEPCPLFQFYGHHVDVFTDPAPNDGHCDSCTIEVTGDYATFESVVSFDQHVDPTLTLTFAGDVKQVMHLPPLPPSTTIANSFDAGTFAGLKTALYTATVDGKTATSEVSVRD
jgi:hypothetical protein